jgi:DNA-directed RNA polymerase subunit M/transcription elongation factor TFIIS
MPELAKSSTNSADREDLQLSSHTGHQIRRCSKCGIRKMLERGFYRDSKGRAGYRSECKKCHNRWRAAWARARYTAGKRGCYRQL